MDFIFPHHECEIAQSAAATGKQPVRYWVYNNMITIIRTYQGWLYLTVIIDLFDRKIVGWAMSNNLAAQSTVIPAWMVRAAGLIIFIERLWRSVKYDHVYLYPAAAGLELYQGLKEYFRYYNHDLRHQGIGREIPVELYYPAA